MRQWLQTWREAWRLFRADGVATTVVAVVLVGFALAPFVLEYWKHRKQWGGV